MDLPPYLSRAQVREVDRLCIEELGLPGLVLMENASLALLDACRRMTGGDVAGRKFAILCGGGNNGGDGYALARHLHNAHADVRLFAARPVDDLDGDAGVNGRVCRAMNLPIVEATPDAIADEGAAIWVDCLLGTGLSTPPRDDAAELIHALNTHAVKILACDLPSGLDADTGRPLGPPSSCVRADETVTFVAPKRGFGHPRSRAWTGDVTVGAIGAPAEIVARAAANTSG